MKLLSKRAVGNVHNSKFTTFCAMRVWYYDDELFVAVIGISFATMWSVNLAANSRNSFSHWWSSWYAYLETWRIRILEICDTSSCLHSIFGKWSSRFGSELTIRTRSVCVIDRDLRKEDRMPFETDSVIKKGARCLFWRLGVDELFTCSENMKSNDNFETYRLPRI